MHDLIKEEIKNLDLYKLTKEELIEILWELFRFFSQIELLPLYRWNPNHIRLYPWLWIEKLYQTSEKNTDPKKIFEDIKKLSKEELVNLHNIYKDEYIIIRNFDDKAYLFDLFYNWDMYYLNEILLLKLFKLWLIDIKLFWFKHDIKTKKWKEFYAFMDNYAIKSDKFQSSETWKTEFDIKGIVEESYEKFINFIFESIIFDDEDSYDYEAYNRLDLIATVKSIKTLFEELMKLLSSYYENNNSPRANFIEILNKSDNIIKIPMNEFFNDKLLFFEYLKFLQWKNKLKINSISLNKWTIDNNKKIINLDLIEISIEKYIYDFDVIHLSNYKNQEKVVTVNYKNWDLFIYWEKINFNDWISKIKTLYKLVFDFFIENNVNKASFEELFNFYNKNVSKYTFKKPPTFKYDYFRRNIEIKNESLPIKDFLGINYNWIECHYFIPEKS